MKKQTDLVLRNQEVKKLNTRLDKIESRVAIADMNAAYRDSRNYRDLQYLAFAVGAILAIVILIYRFMPRVAETA